MRNTQLFIHVQRLYDVPVAFASRSLSAYNLLHMYCNYVLLMISLLKFSDTWRLTYNDFAHCKARHAHLAGHVPLRQAS